MRNSLYVLFSLFLLAACSTPAKKAETYKVYTVEINGMKFVPEELWVRTGDSVVFINNDMVAHNVTDRINNAWASPLLEPGKSWRMAVTKDEDYYCTIHPLMKGRLRIINKID